MTKTSHSARLVKVDALVMQGEDPLMSVCPVYTYIVKVAYLKKVDYTFSSNVIFFFLSNEVKLVVLLQMAGTLL